MLLRNFMDYYGAVRTAGPDWEVYSRLQSVHWTIEQPKTHAVTVSIDGWRMHAGEQPTVSLTRGVRISNMNGSDFRERAGVELELRGGDVLLELLQGRRADDQCAQEPPASHVSQG